MRFSQVLVGAAALFSSPILGANIPAADTNAPSHLEARTYGNVEQCQSDIRSHHGYKFCKVFFKPKTVIVKKTIVKKKGTTTKYKVVNAPCTTRGSRKPPPYYHEKREADAGIEVRTEYDADADAFFAKREAEANAEADAEAHWHRSKKCNRRGVPYRLQKKYSCQTIEKACRQHYHRKTRYETVSRAC